MACVALASLISTIEVEFEQPIPRVSLEEDAPIKSLLDNLSSLQMKSSAAIKELEIKIRDFALETEDDIEIQISNFLLAKDGECREKASRELHQTLREAAEKAAELLNIINSTTGNEADEASETQPSIYQSNQYFESENVDLDLDGSLRNPPRLENKMVGRGDDYAMIKYQLVDQMMEEDGIDAIIQRIMDRKGNHEYNDMAIRQRLMYRMDDRSELKQIWIVGMPGIGKTTLATSIYQDPIMNAYFDVQGWITMPQKYNHREVLCNLLLSIGAATEASAIRSIPPCELADQVRKCLKARRFLIVLDNQWNNRAWDDIKQCFPNDKNGSRILLTTNHFDRASYATSSYYLHNMTLLDSNNSWDIFCNILSGKAHMENIRSREIVEKCDGLPQLIVAVAKRLSRCNNIQQEGKRIEKELDSIGILDRSALSFVFNQLPHHLKVCFLYLGVFPRRSEIPVKMLIGLWVAEGFVKSEYETYESKAYSYLQELIDRSLVLINNWSCDEKVKTCRIHSALHSFCAGEAQKQGIFCAVNTHQHLGLPLNTFANSCRWLSFCTHSFDYYVLFRRNNCHSIFFFLENPEMCAPSNMLRVLAFVSSPFLQRVPKYLGNLVFLRYLSVTQWFEGLDDIVSANPNLQTLIVSHSESQFGGPIFQLPSRIWEPPQLRHLELDNMYMVDPPSMVKENLQTLSWLIPNHCREEVVSRFPNIKKLKIFFRGHFKPSYPNILCHLLYLYRLEMLSFSACVGFTKICSRYLSFPSQLKKLSLSGTNLDLEGLPLIGRLPRLEVLKLVNAFHGYVWEVAEGGFRRLKFLLFKQENLEKLWADYDSFPCLERLVLRSCYCLREIPSSFADIPTLHSIELHMCSRSAVMSAKRIQEEQLELGNEMFKVTVLPPRYEESQ